MLRESRFATTSGGRPTTAADATSWTVTFADPAAQTLRPWQVTVDVLCAAGA